MAGGATEDYWRESAEVITLFGGTLVVVELPVGCSDFEIGGPVPGADENVACHVPLGGKFWDRFVSWGAIRIGIFWEG